MQRLFRIGSPAAALALFASVLAAHDYFLALPDRQPLAPALAQIEFEPVGFSSDDFAPLRLVGAWTLSSEEPRIGGISALAMEGGELIAISDQGAIIRFGKPRSGRVEAEVRDLPDGPGNPHYKRNRDSEGIARDPGGRGWWVAFENRNALWLYDGTFGRSLEQAAIPEDGLGWNMGIEGLASSGGNLLLLPEAGGRAIRVNSTGWSDIPFAFRARRVSGAVALSDASLLVIERRLSLTGFDNALVRLDRCSRGYCLAWRKRLPLGPFDNVEAIAAEPLPSGATRLWLMSDDNFARPLRTVLIAADLPPRP